MQKNNTELKRTLNLFDSTAIVAGSMIGSGIFIVSADIAKTLGSPGWLLVVWVVAGIITLLAALSFGELAGMFPDAGGQYVYLREAYNPLMGFLYGWALMLVIQTGIIAAVGMAFAKFTGLIFPWFSPENILLDIGFFKFNSLQLLAIILIIVLTLNNLFGVNNGKIVQNIFTVTKTLALLGLIVVVLLFSGSLSSFAINKQIFWDAVTTGTNGINSLTGFALVAALGTSMVGALFSLDSWNDVTFISGEIKNPKRNIPLSLFFGTLLVSLLYIGANFAYINALPFRGIANGSTVIERGIQFATNDRVGTAALEIIFGTSGAVIMAVLIMISTFGCNNGIILSGARVLYAMSKDNLFFKPAGKLNKFGVPGNALIFQCIWACVLCLSGTYHELLDYIIFAVLLFHFITMFGIFILRRKRPDIERPYKAFAYPYFIILFLIFALFIMVILLIYKQDYTWRGLLIVLLGVPVFYVWRKIQYKIAKNANKTGQ